MRKKGSFKKKKKVNVYEGNVDLLSELDLDINDLKHDHQKLEAYEAIKSDYLIRDVNALVLLSSLSRAQGIIRGIRNSNPWINKVTYNQDEGTLEVTSSGSICDIGYSEAHHITPYGIASAINKVTAIANRTGQDVVLNLYDVPVLYIPNSLLQGLYSFDLDLFDYEHNPMDVFLLFYSICKKGGINYFDLNRFDDKNTIFSEEERKLFEFYNLKSKEHNFIVPLFFFEAILKSYDNSREIYNNLRMDFSTVMMFMNKPEWISAELFSSEERQKIISQCMDMG